MKSHRAEQATATALAIAHRHSQPPQDEAPKLVPPWREGARAIPNAIARSALFRASAKGRERRMLREEPIKALDGISITQTGLELSQEDGDAWLQLIHLTRGQPIDKPIRTCGYELLKAIDSHANSRDYKRLKDSLKRLQGAQLVLQTKIRNRIVEYVGSLIDDITFSDEVAGSRSSAWEIKLNGKMVHLFAADVYTRLDWQQRLQLTPLAKHLHSFYSSHNRPHALKVQSLYDLCGSSAGELRTFRQSLKLALDQLKGIGFLAEWELDRAADLILVQRAGEPPSLEGPAQGGLL